MIVYKDGSWQPIEETNVSVMDHGFLYGVGLFETFRTYNGIPFLFHDHLKRLRDGLESVYIEWDHSNEQLYDLVTEALEKNGITDGVIRLNVTAGISNWGLPTETYKAPSLLLFTRPVPEHNPGSKNAVVLNRRRNTPEGNTRLKSHHYLNNLLGKRELGTSQDVEGIFLTEEDYVAEGLVSNIFWIKGDTIYTPSISTGILNGVTRKFILHLCSLLNLDVKEGKFPKEELLEADEVFITNSTQEIIRIAKLDDTVFPAVSSSWLTCLKYLYKQSTEQQLMSYQQVKKVDWKNGKYELISNEADMWTI
ncbi:aminodeoxychorismate lyase [Sutcliffiella horikoshii]|uniref:Aminodeoxychorismate lyase n=1 Tax=Sutcliffiella horikoshii TaxID=79883 RepID=A0AA95B418_9BACI|nr:aminodeoxychorismate lyase [Sutcliffiella horikoshii]TYS54469.1 aminodeoxychorismate lyase [Sutcliffiella horikoshii]